MADSIDETFLAGCRRLRVVSATLKGYDNFDAEACTRRGVWLTIVPDTLIAPTGELATGLVIGLMRRITEGHDHVGGGGFAAGARSCAARRCRAPRLACSGWDSWARRVARLLAGFESQVAYHDARRLDAQTERVLAVSYHSLAQLAEASDVIVVALSLTSQTRHLIDARLLQHLRPGAFLVNVGRGSVVDEQAVANALEAGCLRGYAADVFAMEDWALPGHPAGVPGSAPAPFPDPVHSAPRLRGGRGATQHVPRIRTPDPAGTRRPAA